MAYIPRKVVRGEHYAVYKPGVKTKSAVLKEALKRAESMDVHVAWIDFIPSKFSLQLHGWFKDNPTEGYTNLRQVEADIKRILKAGDDPVRKLKGKWHYDLRIQKATAPTWFGLTPFSAPWKGTPSDKVEGTVKGYQSITPSGKPLQKFLLEQAEKETAKQGIAERRDRLEWMKIKAQWFPPNSPGNPQKYENAAMVAIEYFKPAALHRRELDFFDVTFFGDIMKGRFYNRMVPRKLSAEELTQWQKDQIASGKVKEFDDLRFYFWKAMDQWGKPGTVYSMNDVQKAALGQKTLDPLPAPPAKKPKKVSGKAEGPLATKAFH